MTSKWDLISVPGCILLLFVSQEYKFDGMLLGCCLGYIAADLTRLLKRFD